MNLGDSKNENSCHFKISAWYYYRKTATHQVEEVSGVWQLYSSDLIREMYLRTDEPGAVLILECADVEKAKEVLGKLPLVKSSLLNFDIIPLEPFHSLERLFSKSLDTVFAK